MHVNGNNSWLKHIDFIIIDILSLFCAFALSYALKFDNLTWGSQWKNLLLIILLIQLVINLLMNPYSGLFRRRFYDDILRGIQMAIYNLVAVSLFLYVNKVGAWYSREVMLVTYLLYLIVSLTIKYIWKKLLVKGTVKYGHNKLRSLFIIGDLESIDQTLRDAQAADFKEYDIKAVALVNNKKIEGFPQIEIENCVRWILDNRVDEVLIATDPKQIEEDIISTIADNGIPVHVNVESLFEFKPDDQYISRIGICKTLTIGKYHFLPKQIVYLFFKRIFDIVFGLIGCAVLIPLMIVVKLVNIANGDHANLFYRQTRVGHNGKEIRILKFRSMVPNADEVLKELLKDEKYEAEWAANQKFEDDPRITKAGRFLRKTSLDEWPQFVNVLFGDMSLIGPRPLVPGELEDHDGLQLYNKLRPGITGWWGCNGRSNIEYKERLDLEYYYIKHVSFSLDVICIFRTIGAVLGKSGAK